MALLPKQSKNDVHHDGEHHAYHYGRGYRNEEAESVPLNRDVTRQSSQHWEFWPDQHHDADQKHDHANGDEEPCECRCGHFGHKAL